MRLPTVTFLVILCCLTALAAVPDVMGFHAPGEGADGWITILRSLGVPERPEAEARVLVVTASAGANPQPWLARVDEGAILILEGDSAIARELGIHTAARATKVRRVRDLKHPSIPILWEEIAEVPAFSLPAEAQVYCRARRSGIPLVASLRRGRGAVLWTAISPGDEGWERFPFLPHYLIELGLELPFESRRLWAFFDAAYRLRDDPESLAKRWRSGGIAAIHVGAWQYWERDPDGDEYLRKLIAACHRHDILVYAWFELPHVSDLFWKRHPEWREKTARQKDAFVPWRRLMNLVNPDCHRAVAEGVRDLMRLFDWDGVNLAELYFDGVMGVQNLDEFTPLNADVRREFKALKGFDPMELFRGERRDPVKLRAFLDYRVDLAARLQDTWMAELEKLRVEKPGLDMVLTYVDDRFDKSMHDAIGADAARALKTLDRHPATFIVEDPATVWGEGPGRYTEIAKRYRPLTAHWDRVGVDINVVEREGKVYPTKKQVGAELFQLIRAASESFTQVMFYYEFSILPADMPLLGAASAVVSRSERTDGTITVETPYGVGIHWQGPATLDSVLWPVRDRDHVWVPAGKHALAPANSEPSTSLVDFNGVLETALSRPDGIEFRYNSRPRALATFDRKPVKLVLDGQGVRLDLVGDTTLRLPPGRHTAVVTVE